LIEEEMHNGVVYLLDMLEEGVWGGEKKIEKKWVKMRR
jgi:hypothetical protein